MTVAVLAVGCVGLILVGGFFDNLMEGLREQFIHSQTGHLQVNADGYYKMGVTAPLDYLMKDVSRVRHEIELSPHVLFTVPRLKFSGMASSSSASMPVLVIGTDPFAEHRMGAVKATNATVSSVNIAEGQDLDPADPYGAILGKGLLKALGLKVGDSVNLMTTRQAGAIDGAEYHVRGVFETILKDVDNHAMKVSISSAQKILGVSDQLHSFLVLLDDTKNTPVVEEELRKRFQTLGLGLEVLSWEKQGQYYHQSRDFLDKIYSTIQLIISVVFFFSIANTINMAVLERVREFGTMMAIGNSRGTVFMMIVMEVFFIGFIGSLVGLAVGAGASGVVNAIGIEMPPPPQGSHSYLATISLSWHLMLAPFVTTIFSTVFSSFLPAYRASNFRIIEALGYI